MNLKVFYSSFVYLVIFAMAFTIANAIAAEQIVHDAEYYVLEAQNGKRWTAENKELKKRLADLQKKFGRPPTSFTSCGTTQPMVISASQPYRRFEASKHRISTLWPKKAFFSPACIPKLAALPVGQPQLLVAWPSAAECTISECY